MSRSINPFNFIVSTYGYAVITKRVANASFIFEKRKLTVTMFFWQIMV